MSFDVEYLKKGIIRVLNVHIFSIIISAFMTFFAPKLLSTYDYGIWQLYLLYVGYVGFFHFGWLDGLYLRLAGKEYDKIDKNKLNNELFFFSILQTVISIIIILFSVLFLKFDRCIATIFVGIALLLVNVKFYFVYIMQATGRVKEFSNVAFLQSMIQCILFLFINNYIKNYLSIIFADILANFFTLIISIIYCYDIAVNTNNAFSFIPTFSNVKNDVFENINVGSKLMIANILSLLTTGIIRIGIERQFGVATFGIISLALTFSALCINILNSMGVVFIPMIKNKNIDATSKLYDNLHLLLDFITFLLMIFYYPVKVFFIKIMPNYATSFDYLAITFPIMYFGCLQSLLQNTYLKAFRKEKYIFFANLYIIIFSIIITYIGTNIVCNLNIMVCAIVLIYIIRNIVYEYFISKSINSKKLICYILQSILMPFVFTFSNYCIKGYYGLFTYFVFYVMWYLLNRKYILSLKKSLVKNL